MPPKVKFQKEEIVASSVKIVRERGVDALTAREVANALGVSTRPIFTYFDTMDELKAEVYAEAKRRYLDCIRQGLESPIPFLGLWQQYVRFAKEESELYKLLFLTKQDGAIGGAMEALELSKEMARPSVMRFYGMDEKTADNFFRNIWLVAFSFSTLIVTNDCPYTDEEIFGVGREISLALCKAYKEIPGFSEGNYDPDAVFRKVLNR